MQKELMFSIITPTYKRPEILIRCVKSVLSQKINTPMNNKNITGNEACAAVDFEIIIVNDSPDYDYSIFENELEKNTSSEINRNKDKIKYFKNKENMGVNYSRNFALKNISNDSDYVIFLDDDDWLNEYALLNAESVIKNNSNYKWYVSNRATKNNNSLSKNNTNKNTINYFSDYLIFKKFHGDVTHFIKSDVAKKYKFSTKIKNGEEWFYFIQIPYNFFYFNHNSTFTSGYSEEGLNASMQKTYKENTKILWTEIKTFSNIKVFTYMLLRTLYLLTK